MEQECIEEYCNYEEAREIFEDRQVQITPNLISLITVT